MISFVADTAYIELISYRLFASEYNYSLNLCFANRRNDNQTTKIHSATYKFIQMSNEEKVVLSVKKSLIDGSLKRFSIIFIQFLWTKVGSLKLNETTFVHKNIFWFE